MSSVLRAVAIYVFLLALFRVAGRRTLSQLTSFDLVLALIVSEAVSQTLNDGDGSFVNAVLAATTLVGLDVGFAWLKTRFPRVDDVLEGRPSVLVRDGRCHDDAMRRARVDRDDVLAAARRVGLANLEQVRYAILETTGQISIIPRTPRAEPC